MTQFETMVAETSAEVAAKTGLEGRELKAATFDFMADCVEDIVSKDPTALSGPGVIYMYREMARQTRTGEIT
jgi:hypothetical protein